MIVYSVKKKLGCIFLENHISECILLKPGQTVEVVTSCIVKLVDEVQQPVWRDDTTQSTMKRLKTPVLEGASVERAEKTDQAAESL